MNKIYLVTSIMDSGVVFMPVSALVEAPTAEQAISTAEAGWVAGFDGWAMYGSKPTAIECTDMVVDTARKYGNIITVHSGDPN